MSVKIDPVSMSVINNYLETTVKEMGIAMRNTAYSTLFSEGLDFSCALFDEKGEILTQAQFIPAQIGAMRTVVEWTIKEIGIDNFHDGDVFIHNDPYRGGCHLPEFCVLSPFFYKSELSGFAAVIGHMAETGAMAPTSMPGSATEVFQEGLRFPPVKMVDRGEDVDDIWNIMLANVRTPRGSYGDVKAMIAANDVGKRRVTALLDKYGLEYFRTVKEELKKYAERMIREEIKKFPDGVFESEGCWADDDGVEPGKPIMLKVKIIKEGDQIICDYTGTDKQVKGCVNGTYGVTQSGTWGAILFLIGHPLSEDIPANEGRYKPVKTIVPAGTVLNVEYPGASCGGNSENHPHIYEAIFRALMKAMPDKIPAECGGTSSLVTLGGIHPDTGEPYNMINSECVGYGGRPWADGQNTTNVYHGNCDIIQVEVLESRYPMLHTKLSLNEDSGGAGKYRGGLGMIRTYMVYGPETRISSIMERVKVAPRGIWGGKDGEKGRLLVKTHDDNKFRTFVERFSVKCPGKFSDVLLGDGDVVKIVMPGGGGWRDPLERDFSLIIHDIEEGFISKEKAIEDYKIVLKEVDGRLQIDHKKTEELRGKQKGVI